MNADSGSAQPASNLQLSYRERQILDNMCKGLTNREIAAALQLTDGTIKHYLTALFKKLDVRNRMQAIQVAKSLQKAKRDQAIGRRLRSAAARAAVSRPALGAGGTCFAGTRFRDQNPHEQ